MAKWPTGTFKEFYKSRANIGAQERERERKREKQKREEV